MIIYSGNKIDFLRCVEQGKIVDSIIYSLKEKMHRHSSQSEIASWQNSLTYMYIVLNDKRIPDNSGIAIEYNLPQTAKRVDFIVSGYNDNNQGSAIIIELKQWSDLSPINGMDALVSTYTGGALRNVVHPSYQAWSYAETILDYCEYVQENSIGIYPCAFLHNYHRDENKLDVLDYPQYQPYLKEAPAFTSEQIDDLRFFIEDKVKIGDNQNIIERIDHGKIKPSKSLQDVIGSMLKGNEEFIMLDEQKVVYEHILDLAKRSKEDGKKRVIIVDGGPGTGKTVVAINLLVALTCAGQVCQYTSKNSAPRAVYKEKLKGEMKTKNIDMLFKGSGSYVDVLMNCFDTLIVDEAHRLNAKSGMFSNLGENQIKEIINAAKCSVFFIDESQRVTLKDVGSDKEIEKWAQLANAEIYHYELLSQFRCNGSDGYLAWLDNTLEIKETANYNLEGFEYDFRVLDNPNEVKDLIFERNKINNKSRIVAGYCWDWNKEHKADPDYCDIVIGDFKMPWNLSSLEPFAIAPTSINEVGCIHTTQGLEFDYVGVIIGDDLRYENGHVITDFTKRAKTDQSLKGIKTMYKEDRIHAMELSDELIKNTYRTLMARGMKGCYVYCTDKALSNYLKECLKNE